MSFDEIPSELKEYIFTYFSPNDWINTAKVSTEWLTLTLGCFKKIESCHLLILNHLAEFKNQETKTNYTWVSLVAKMAKLKYLDIVENTEAFWREIRKVCHQLEILDIKPRNNASFDWNTLDIIFTNLVELLWDGTVEGFVFPLELLSMCPKLEKLKVRNVRITAQWQNKIPKSVKHILLDIVIFDCKDQCSLNYLCEDASFVETFSAKQVNLPSDVSDLFDATPRLKNIELDFVYYDTAASKILESALRKCQSLETVKATNVTVTETWQSVFPEKVISMDLSEMKVEENIRDDFKLAWLFQNYDGLQSLELRSLVWTRLRAQSFKSTQNLKKLCLNNYAAFSIPLAERPITLFSIICNRMIRGSHLVHVEICKLTIFMSWRFMFPPTVKRLKLKDILFSLKAQENFSPQFICEIPSNLESLTLNNFQGNLPLMDLNAFTGMYILQNLNLDGLRLSGVCLRSIWTHCSALTDLVIERWTEMRDNKDNLDNFVFPSLKKLGVKEPVEEPALLLQHFPKLLKVDIAIVPPEASFSAIMNALREAESVNIKIRGITLHRLRYLVESIDDTKYKYCCLSIVSIESSELNFYWTNSLLDACRKLDDIISRVDNIVLWIKNYPASSLLRTNFPTIPSTIDEMCQQYETVMSQI